MNKWGGGMRALLLAGGVVAGLAGAANASTLTTEYAANNWQNGDIFDVQATSALTITGFSQNFLYAGTSSFAIYYRVGSANGYTNSSAGWTLLGTADNLPTNAKNTPTVIPISLSLDLTAGETVGLYLTTTDSTLIAYTIGTAVGAVAAVNNDLTIDQGYGDAYPFGATYSPRVWNGTINYTLASTAVPEPASLALLGIGVVGVAAIRRRARRG